MVALLDDLAILHHEDRVGVADRRQPVGDHEARAIGAQSGHGVLDEHLGARVDRARRLVEDENRRIGEECPGDRHELALTGAEVAALIIDDGVVAVGKRVDEAVDVADPRRLDDLLLGCAMGAVGDVVADGPAEQPGILEDHPDLGPQSPARHRGDVDAIEADRPVIELVEAHDEVDQRRLAGARRPDDRHGLSGPDVE